MSSEDLAVGELQIHMDSLEYTRAGLRSRDSIAVELTATTRVVLVRPTLVDAVAASHGGFASACSFPLPAFLSLFLFQHRGNVEELFSGTQPRAGVYQVFAHTHPTGAEQADKDLTDRRARMAVAFLVGDVKAVVEIAQQERWGVDVQQAMLRALFCDPGPIDGKLGALTAQGVSVFQNRYGAGTFHERLRRAPLITGLRPSGQLDAETALALLDAYVCFHSPELDAKSLHPTHPQNGCAGFNPLGAEAQRANHRVSLVVREALPPHHDGAPCQAGDAAACPVVEPSGCSWYRAHVNDAALAEVQHHHFRLAWLAMPNGKVLLSALTTVLDIEEVTFEVFAATMPVDGEHLIDPTALVEPLGDVIRVRPLHGIAQAIWEPPSDFAVTAAGELDRADGRPLSPVFRVSHEQSGAVAFDAWPVDEVAILFDRSLIDSSFSAHQATELELICEEQSLRLVRATADAQPYDEDHYIVRFAGLEEVGLFTLLVRYGDGATCVIFEDVPFSNLGDHGGPADPLPTDENAESMQQTGGERQAAEDEADEEFDAAHIELPLLRTGDVRDEISFP